MADFNPSCAEWVYDTISKMDDGEAESFALMMVHDLWSHDMAANERFVRTHQAQQDRVYTEDVAKALLEHLEDGGDPQEAVAIAAAVAIAKDDHDWWKFQERNQGRFGRMTGAQYRAQKAGIKANDKKARADLQAKRRGYLTSTNGQGGLYGDVAGASRGVLASTKRFEGNVNRKPSSEMSGATDTFGRLQAGGQLVQELGAATGSNKTAIAGAVANYAGQFGPEAEKVVGPSMRRAAYRYRGTERTPDRQYLYLAQQNLNGIKRGEKATPAEKTMAAENSAIQYFLGGDVSGRKGESRLPKPKLSGLHQAAGRITPSEGILIDAQGNVAHQAVGYGEDHYLPFNLKNLGALKGGSYVRTRASGGLTTEDVYTGLVSGARSMTVVSNSGIFTVDFADDLRGGRRYNDKARQMVTRYGHLLDAVQSEKVANPENQLSALERARIRVAAEKKVNTDPVLSTYPAKERDAWIDAAVAEEEAKPRLSEEDLATIRAKAKEQGGTKSEQEVLERAFHAEKLEQMNQRNYRLDGQGYATALDALHEQFPYYIGKPHYRTVNHNDSLSPDRFNRSTDAGYVKPKYNRPAGAKAGYFDESINGQGKRGADKTGYQNHRVRSSRTDQAPSEQGAEVKAGGAKGETPEQAKERVGAQHQATEQARKYASEVGKDAKVWVTMDSDYDGALNLGDHDALDAFRDLDDSGREAFLSDPTKVGALEKDLDALEKKVGGRLQSADEIPRNRKNFARKAKSVDVSTVVAGLASPVAAPAIEAKTAEQVRASEMFQRLAGLSDEDLRSRSNTLRTQREQTEPAKRPEFDKAILAHEQVRAAKVQGRTEIDADTYQREVANRTGVLKEVPKITAAGGNDELRKRLEMLKIAHGRGQVTDEQFHGDAKDMIDASDLTYEEKIKLHRDITGNIYR